MKIINLAHQSKSEVNYEIFTFPDGEPHIKLGKFDRKEEYTIKCRICNPFDLFILMQVCDILNRSEVYFKVEIYYLMSMRMDRVMSFNEAFSLKVVMSALNSTGISSIEILEPHSDKAHILSKNICSTNLYPNTAYDDEVIKKKDDYTIILPDKGAHERYIWLTQNNKNSYIVCNKVRDTSTGKLLSFEIVEDASKDSDKPMLVVDDLCDGGGTFAGIAKLLREKYPNRKLNIFVTHMVNSKGIQTLSENYDEVVFTNSYMDWQYTILPKNVKVINVI